MSHSWKYLGKGILIIKGRSVGATTMSFKKLPPTTYVWQCLNCNTKVYSLDLFKRPHPKISCDDAIIKEIIE